MLVQYGRPANVERCKATIGIASAIGASYAGRRTAPTFAAACC
jgi:hypothetical protein